MSSRKLFEEALEIENGIRTDMFYENRANYTVSLLSDGFQVKISSGVDQSEDNEGETLCACDICRL